jgi:uncharacterized protein (DUF983 family)
MKRSRARERSGTLHETPLVQTQRVGWIGPDHAAGEHVSVHALRRSHRRAARGGSRIAAVQEATTESGLDVPSMRQTAIVAWRTLRLRCANCGKGKVLRSFSAVNNRCSNCGLRFWRGEEDYFSGALLFGLEAGFAIALLGLLIVVALTWPTVPWGTVELIGLPLLFVGMICLYVTVEGECQAVL